MQINKLYNIDFLKNDIKDESIDLIITDPPYGVGYKNNIYDDSKEAVFNSYGKWLEEFYRVLKPNSHIYIYIPTLEVDRWVSEVKKYFKFNNLIAVSTHQTSRYLKNNFCMNTQLIIYASKGQAKELNDVDFIETSKDWLNDKRNKEKNPYTYKYPSFIKDIKANMKPNKIKLLHPNQKNAELIEFFIKLSSNEKDLILEPFLGSGSTVEACINTKRNYIGYELNKEVFNIAEKRVKSLII